MIFNKAGLPQVQNLNDEWADGILYQRLFNLVYNERIDCNLTASTDYEVRLTNWSRINQLWFISYLQKKYYLTEAMM